METITKSGKILLGAGNSLRGDDGAGSVLSARFRCPGWLSLDGGTMPESYSGVIRKEAPSLLVIVDTCEMGLSPGQFRIVPAKRLLLDYSFNTHRAPLGVLIERLGKYAERIVFIGIQPEKIDFGEGLSLAVSEALEDLEDILKNDQVFTIPFFQS